MRKLALSNGAPKKDVAQKGKHGVLSSKAYGLLYLVKANNPERAYVCKKGAADAKQKFLFQVNGEGSHARAEKIRKELGDLEEPLSLVELHTKIAESKPKD